MRNEKKFYVGGGIAKNAFLYAFPIMLEYCKIKKINTIILPDYLVEITKEKVFKDKVRDIIFVSENKILPFNYKSNFLIFFTFFFKSIKLFFKINKKNLLDKKNTFTEVQIYHGAWDIAQRAAKDGSFSFKNEDLSYNKWEIFKSCFKVSLNIEIGKILFQQNVNSALIAHNVYQYKSLCAIFRKKNIDILHINSFVIYRQKKFKDTCFTLIDKNLTKLMMKKIKKKEIIKYFNEKISGKSKYDDSNFSFKKTQNFKTIKNVIFLQIFRDSSFKWIDRDRIFVDQLDWFIQTMKILSNTDEEWYVKIHPSSLRWGENQKTWIDSVIKKLFGKNFPKNIIFETKSINNNDLLKSAKKIVSYHGSIINDAIAFGIKPISVNENTATYYDKNLAFKPKNLNEYEKLLKDKNPKNFKVSKKQAFEAKKLIFIKENLFEIRSSINAKKIFENDDSRFIKKDYTNIRKKIKNNFYYFEQIAHLLDRFDFSMNKRYINKFLKN